MNCRDVMNFKATRLNLKLWELCNFIFHNYIFVELVFKYYSMVLMYV